MSINVYEVEEEFKRFVDRSGFDRSDLYVGIASDAEDALFRKHKVDRGEEDHYMVRDCGDADHAVEVAKYLIEELGLDGDAVGSSSKAETVYVYKKEVYTEE